MSDVRRIPVRGRKGLARDCVLSLRRDVIVSGADPFGLNDELPASLPRWNAEQNTGELKRLADRLVGRLDGGTGRDAVTCAAQLRDLGFVAASLARHEVGLDAVPGLEAALVALGNATEEVPRDTVYSYASRNPGDHRMRTFTHWPEERLFIEAVNESTHALAHAVDQLELADLARFGSAESVHHLEQTDVHMRRMVRQIHVVIRHVTPARFTYDLRPYFPPMEIGGRRYFAPGGAQMALIILDVMLFGLDWSAGPEFETYLAENLIYLPPAYRNLADDYLQSGSLLASWLAQARQQQSGAARRTEHVPEALDAVESLVKAMLRFRYPHRNLAAANFQLRPSEALGSGGYQVDSLSYLVDMTGRAHADLRRTRTEVGAA